MKLHYTIVIAVLFGFSLGLKAQENVAINATGVSADPSAQLDVASTSKGMLFPRMSDAEMNNIANPAEGLIIFNTDQVALAYYQSGEWHFLFGTVSRKIIFVTNATTNGNIGGPTAADAICQSEASAANLDGSFKALVSVSGLELLPRWSQLEDAYGGGLYLPSGIVVAENWLDLDNTILNAVNENASGTVVPASEVWTGLFSTTNLLQSNSNNCLGWTSSGGSGYRGSTTETDYRWTTQSDNCSELKRLYCVQQ